MEKREISWKKEALAFIGEYVQWYRATLGQQAVNKFLDSIEENINRLQQFPTIGINEQRYNIPGFTVRSISIYKYYRILYAYDNKQLIIIAFWDMRSIIIK